MAVGQRPGGSEKAIRVDVWEKRIPGRRNSQYEGPDDVQSIAGWSLLTAEGLEADESKEK